MRYESVKARTLLSKKMVADSWFHVNRTLNAYRGCEHGCVYCDGMSEYYHVENFTTHIRAKENAPEILDRELKKDGFTSRSTLETETLWSFLDDDDAKRIALRVPRRIVIGVCGGVSDGYQPAEKEYEITRRILKVLYDYGIPVFILTKSDLVLRDLDLLKDIHKRAYVNVMFTITLHDETIQKIFEPKAPTTQERFDALTEIRKAGIHGGVMSTPIIPTIGDSVENMEGLAKEAKSANAEFIQFGGMTLKPGRQKDYFLSVVQKRFPDSLEAIERIYSNNDRYGSPQYKYMPVSPMLLGYQVCKKIGIRDRSIRHGLPYDPEANIRVLNVLLDIIFRQSYYLGYSRGKNKPYCSLATRIENGLPDLLKLREEATLRDHLLTNDRMVSIVEEILETDNCHVLEDLEKKIDLFSKDKFIL